MATPVDRLPSNDEGRNPTKTAKQNFVAIKYGNEKGSISMGHIHEKGDVTSGVMLQTPDAEHQLSLDIDGPRKGWTTLTSPGACNIEAGSWPPPEGLSAAEKAAWQKGKEFLDSVTINAKNGNIDITASNGKIRLLGTDIELVALGEGGSKGNITMTASETIELKSKKFLSSAKTMYKICTPGIGIVTANGILSMYGSIFSAITDAVTGKPSKLGGQREQKRENLLSASPDAVASLDRGKKSFNYDKQGNVVQ